MIDLYYYIYKNVAATSVECGLKLSVWFDNQVIIEGSSKKCITAFISPYDDKIKFESADLTCLKLKINPQYCYVADGDKYNHNSDDLHLTNEYIKSILPAAKYTINLYKNPEYLITCTVLPEQIKILNRKLYAEEPFDCNEVSKGKQNAVTTEEIDKKSNTQSTSQFGELLVEKGLISKNQLTKAIEFQAYNGGRLGDILVSFDYVKKEQLEDSIPIEAKKKPIGELLVEKGYISSDQLELALGFQRKSGGKMGDILLSLNMISTGVLFRELATQYKVGRVGKLLDFKNALKLPHAIAHKYNAILINNQNNRYLMAVVEILSSDEIEEIETYLDLPVDQVLAARSEVDDYWNIVYGEYMSDESINKLAQEEPQNSAFETFTKPQLIFFASLPIITIIFYFKFGFSILIFLNIVIQLLYFLMSIFKFRILLYGSNDNSQIRISKEKLANIDETLLPIYTILVPMYKEKEVIPQLIFHINKLDYPKSKLDVRLLLEEDDKESYEVIKAMNLAAYFTTIVVPHSLPKTKPKACNYGLIRARGKYVVIFDAEDRPDVDQLKKAYLAFEKLPDEYICIQAKLNYFNSNQNLLTKWFTQEYSMWFELLLPGVMKLDIPIPLGGTSNHFKLDYLKKINAWDPYNVTEDADLGVRIFKDGYKTAVVDSRTWEEANSELNNWLRQRSRWIKGYMQTWLVHMRNPFRLLNELGLKGFLGFQVMVLGTPLLTLLNPFFWALVVIWYGLKPHWIEMLFPGGIYYIALIQLIIGNFIFIYSNVLGMYWIIHEMSIEKETAFSYKLVKYALLSPIYWLLMSVAAFKAFWQLITKPFYWEKTNHGLTKDNASIMFDKNISG